MGAKQTFLEEVYNLLKNDSVLQGYFSDGVVRIHTRWGLPEINFPYIIMRLGMGTSDLKGFWNGEMIIDIFDQSRDISKALDIANRIKELLDWKNFDLGNGIQCDCWLDGEGEIEEPEDDIVRWNLVFSIRLFEADRI